MKEGNVVAFFDPGAKTGVTLIRLTHGDHHELVTCGTLKYVNAAFFLSQLHQIRDTYGVVAAVVEEYANYGKRYVHAYKVYLQEALICEVFEKKILLPKKSWDPRGMRPHFIKSYARAIGWTIDKKTDEHAIDSLGMALMCCENRNISQIFQDGGL